MKTKLKFIIPIAFILALVIVLTINVSRFAKEQDKLNAEKRVINYNNVQMTEVIDKVFLLDSYTELDYEKAKKYLKEIYDNFGCSACVTKLENGDMCVGRNYDLSISKKPCYIVKTNVKDNYKTLGLSYTNMSFDDYSDVVEKGLSNDALSMIPFAQSDVLNEKGLYIEMNMRTNEYDKDGKSIFASSGTNPESKERVCSLMVPMYLAMHCKNVNDAVKVANDLDIYSLASEKCDFILSYLIADKKGNYGILEVIDNKLIWHSKENIQTNFFLDKDAYDIEKYRCGIGRYDLIKEEIDGVKTEEDMRSMMDKVLYFTMYDLDNCKFDNTSEFAGLYEDWTNEYLEDEDNKETVRNKIRSIGNKLRAYDRNEIEELNTYWKSIYSVVCNLNKLTMNIKYNEDDDRIVTIGFDD